MARMKRARTMAAAGRTLLAASLLLAAASSASAARSGTQSWTGASGSPQSDPRAFHIKYVEDFGYKCEFHQTTTRDGYVLGLFRIPHGASQNSATPGKVAVLQHGLLGSSFGWVVNLPHQSLAYMLADAGYDVWMPNTRGNVFSRNNTHLNPDEEAFWDFSWDDQLELDLPAVYDYVLGETGNSDLVYVGHSQGTTMMFGGLSDPKIAPLLQPRTSHYIALAPVAYVGNTEQQLLKDLADMGVAEQLYKFGVKEWLPDEWILHYIDPVICDVSPTFCQSLLIAFSGCSLRHKNATAVANYLDVEPAGTSVKNVVHWSQQVRENSFTMFDYESPEANRQHYNQTDPPKYDLSQIQLPNSTIFFAGGFDTLADPTDVDHLILLMQEATKNDQSKFPYTYKVLDYDHLDFTLADDAYIYVYSKILEHIP